MTIQKAYINPKRAILLCDYTFTWKDGSYTCKVTIPRGFQWDGASIPRLFWTAVGISRWGAHDDVACVHDYLYVNEGVVKDIDYHYSRKAVDKLFYEGLIKCGYSKRLSKWIYYVVRVFGYYYWRTWK